MKSNTSNSGTALITGAASGLGYEFAKLLAADAYRLILIDIDKDGLKVAEENLKNENGNEVRSIVADLSTPGIAANIFKQIQDEKIEVIINNAGYGLSGLFKDTSWLLEEKMINLHVLLPTQLIKLLLNDMISRGSGKIMNISSLAGFTPGPLMSIYFATKAYLLSFGSALANELKGTGVTVTTICPGLTRTRFAETRAGFSRVKTPEPTILYDSSERVALIAYRAMLKGKAVSIPVFKNRIMTFLSWLAPRPIAVRFVRKSQNKFNKT